MNSNTINSDAHASWSDVDGFYKRVHWLSTEAHASSNDDEDINDYFMCLEQLHYEIEGAIKSNNDKQELENMRFKILSMLLKDELKNKKLLYKRNILGQYQRLINSMAHKYGLYLRKSVQQSLDSWDDQ